MTTPRKATKTRKPPTASHPLVRSFLRGKGSWGAQAQRNAIWTYNRWCVWLAERKVELVDATRDHCAEYLNERKSVVAGSTAHKDYQRLMALYEWLRAEGELPQIVKAGRLVEQESHGPMANVESPAVNEPLPERIQRVSEPDYRRLIASFDRRKVRDCRDAAICSLMWCSGPRRSEVSIADLAGLDLDERVLLIRGKFGKWRNIPLAEETVVWLERYLRRRADDPATALFAATMNANDALEHGRLSPDGISSMLERRCEAAGIRVTAHQFRRAATGEMRANRLEDTDVAQILGWAPSTAKLMLARYTASEADELARAAFHRADPTAKRPTSRRRLKAG
jgi:integrase/recombinase XerD